VAQIAPRAVWCEAAHEANRLMNSLGESQPLGALASRRVAAFCGIGNPAGFRHTLTATGCKPVVWREYPDHHAYTAANQAELVALAKSSKADMIVCTQKDLVKLPFHELGGIPLCALAIEMKFLRGQEALEQTTEVILQKARSKEEH
jgi:tetraacyldisaccharide 4'-kinase